MSKFTDRLWRDLVREHGPALAQADRPAPGRFRLRRPRVLAGGTLGLAGVGAVLLLALGGSAATTTAAFAITKNSDGSVLVKLNYQANQNLPQVEQRLAQMGTHEAIYIDMKTGPAPVSGPVTCTKAPGDTGPTVRVLSGANGTEVIAPGESADNTAEGTFHLASCIAMAADSGSSGNTGS